MGWMLGAPDIARSYELASHHAQGALSTEQLHVFHAVERDLLLETDRQTCASHPQCASPSVLEIQMPMDRRARKRRALMLCRIP